MNLREDQMRVRFLYIYKCRWRNVITYFLNLISKQAQYFQRNKYYSMKYHVLPLIKPKKKKVQHWTHFSWSPYLTETGNAQLHPYQVFIIYVRARTFCTLRSNTNTNLLFVSFQIKLERVLGVTVSSNAGLDCDPNTETVAYPAGWVKYDCVIWAFYIKQHDMFLMLHKKIMVEWFSLYLIFIFVENYWLK